MISCDVCKKSEKEITERNAPIDGTTKGAVHNLHNLHIRYEFNYSNNQAFGDVINHTVMHACKTCREAMVERIRALIEEMTQ